MRQLILEAAIDELQVNSAAAFTLERVAARAGLEPRAIQQLWPNSPALFAATLTSYTSRHLPAAPDTGTLSGDLLDYANSYAEMVNTPIGRRLLDSVIARPTDWDALGVREHYLRPGKTSPP